MKRYIAKTTNTIFRWTQIFSSGDPYDNWGLDNIKINSGSLFSYQWKEKNDSILRSYLGFNKKFNDQKIELIRRSLENRKDNKNDSVLIIDNLLTQLNKRQFLHNANYALRNKDYEISPYIAITDLVESNKILDTIYKSLNISVKNSKYSKILESMLN